MKDLPKKLLKEPLLDAIFEIRFSSELPLSDIIPGYLFGKLDEKKSISSLPPAQLPKMVRETDPNLKFSPLVKLDWNQFSISVGDRNLLISCQLPYPGWANFKPVIIKILDYLKELNVIQSVDRYSMKYVDLIQRTTIGEQIDCLNIDLMISGHKLKQEPFQFRMEIPENNFVNIIQLISSTKVSFPDGDVKEGIIVDIDTIYNLNNVNLLDAIQDVSAKLENIHNANKKMFFDCLKPETIKSLEPVYE